MNPKPSQPSSNANLPRVVCFVNGIYSESIGGGDVYFYFMARAALDAGYPLHFFGGHAFKNYLEKNKLPLNLTLTDDAPGKLGNVFQLAGQFRLLWDFRRRLLGTLRRLDAVQMEDIAYAMSDYWFDAIPLIRCRARRKILYLGMIAPTFSQVVFKSRADVTTTRLSSLYYWMSQQLSLRWFRRVRGGVVTYSHPEMREYLLRFGYEAAQLFYVPNGSDVSAAERVPPQPKQFDLAWVGRVHPQKGIDDLLATLAWLKKQLPNFRAIIIGKSKETLEPVVRSMGLADNVAFSGLVTEAEKFRLLKASRVFAMPSHYESWGIVVGEALAAGVPVVAYRLDCYPDVYGDFLRYVRPFDREAFQRAVEDEIQNQRAGKNYLDRLDLAHFKKESSWETAQKKFLGVLAGLK
jgi:glycosyltransferase involved in cell wall biosynthesis